MAVKLRDLTAEEKKAIAALQKVAKSWPKTLWLFSGSGTLHVMLKDAQGKRQVGQFGSMEDKASVATIPIENDGGDW